MRNQGQIAIEYLILIGFILVALIPLGYYASVRTTNELRGNQARDAVVIIADAADKVSLYGEGSNTNVWVTIPSGISESSIENNQVLVRISIFGSTTDILSPTIANLTGSIPTEQGRHKVKLTVQNRTVHVE